MATSPEIFPTQSASQPAWDVALLFPIQGDWSENDYLALDTKRLVELVDGSLEVLPVPTIIHQLIVKFLFLALQGYVEPRKIGTVLFAPTPIKIRPKSMREPDVIYVAANGMRQASGKYLTRADLVIEVVSDDSKSQQRDYQDKRKDYAELSVSEYWIVDPQSEAITVLVLDGSEYRTQGEYSGGQQAASQLLSGFAVDVSAVFAAGRAVP